MKTIFKGVLIYIVLMIIFIISASIINMYFSVNKFIFKVVFWGIISGSVFVSAYLIANASESKKLPKGLVCGIISSSIIPFTVSIIHRPEKMSGIYTVFAISIVCSIIGAAVGSLGK